MSAMGSRIVLVLMMAVAAVSLTPNASHRNTYQATTVIRQGVTSRGSLHPRTSRLTGQPAEGWSSGRDPFSTSPLKMVSSAVTGLSSSSYPEESPPAIASSTLGSGTPNDAVDMGVMAQAPASTSSSPADSTDILARVTSASEVAKVATAATSSPISRKKTIQELRAEGGPFTFDTPIGALNPYAIYYGCVSIILGIPWFFACKFCQFLYWISRDKFDRKVSRGGERAHEVYRRSSLFLIYAMIQKQGRSIVSANSCLRLMAVSSARRLLLPIETKLTVLLRRTSKPFILAHTELHGSGESPSSSVMCGGHSSCD